MAFRGGSGAGRITRSTRWGGLRIEPYDPNARDADNDGIVQEGTAWERPAGTFVLDGAGREITQGQESAFRPRGLRIVQRDNLSGRGYTDVPYTPTYEAGGQQEISGTATALSEHGSRSLREQGFPSIRDVVTPPRPEPVAEAPKPVEAAASETFTGKGIDGFVENMNDVLDVVEEVSELDVVPETSEKVAERIEKVEKPTKKKSAKISDLSSAFRSWTETKGLFKRRLRLEPYDPDARDGDGDGIVQEGTAWERPVGTRILDGSGNEIRRGYISYNRSKSHRVVDENGKDVDYVPSYQRADVGTIGQTLGTIGQQGRSRRLNVWVPDNPEFHGVQRETENGWGNPLWSRLQEWGQRFLGSGRMSPIRGIPIAWDDPSIPDTVFHVTPAFRQIMADRVIRAGGVGGLGGDNADQIVSMTVSREVAENLLSDMLLMREYGRATTPEQRWAILLADAKKYGIDLSFEDEGGPTGLRQYLDESSNPSMALNMYWYRRNNLGGPPNPVVFDLAGQVTRFAALENEDFGIVEIPRERLNNGAMLTDFDLGKGFLEEIRSYGDVSVVEGEADSRQAPQTEVPAYLSRPVIGLDQLDGADEVQDRGIDWPDQNLRMDHQKHRVSYRRIFDSARNYVEMLWQRDRERRDGPSTRIFRALGFNVTNERSAVLALRQMFPSLSIWEPIPAEDADRVQELRQQAMEEAENLVTEIYEDRPVHIAVRSGTFFGTAPRYEQEGEGVIWDERYKSQFETGRSEGLLDPDWRAGFERIHMGIDLDIPDDERPIYGFVPNDRASDPAEMFQWNSDPLIENETGVTDIYGDVVIVLRPEVKDRTTITFGDSLNNSSYPIPLNPELRRVHREAIGEQIVPEDEFDAEDALINGASDPLLSEIIGPRLVDRLIEERLGGRDGLSDLWRPGAEWRSGRFIEAQIHGGVDFNDVKEVILPARTLRLSGAPVASDVTTLEFMASDDPRAKRLMDLSRTYGFTISHIDNDGLKTILFDPKQEAEAESAEVFTGSTPDPVPSVNIEAVDDSPSATEDAADRPDLEPPVKPRRPYTPAPPPFTGRAAEIVDDSGQDFQAVLDGLDEAGYWILDFETTGFDHGNMPVQVAMIRVENGEIVERVNQFINPDRPLSDWSRQHLRDGDGNPLTEEWLADNGISVAEAQELITGMVNGQIVVAHNAPFDLEVLERIVRDHNGVLELDGTVDTLALMRMAIPKGDGETGPKSHALSALADHLGYNLGEAAHDAMADVEATNEVLRRGLQSAVDNPRADTDVLDNEFMKESYEEAQRQHAIDMAKYRDAMREYNRAVFQYQRALAQGKDVENENVRVPYVPGTTDLNLIDEQFNATRRGVRQRLASGIVDLLLSGPYGSEYETQWDELFALISQVETSAGPPWEVRDGETVTAARRRWVSAYVDMLLSSDDAMVREIIDESLTTHTESELAKQVYIALTPSAASEMIRAKRIRSSFETPGAGQTLSLRDRATREEETLGVPRGIGDKQRPVYGVVPRSSVRVFGSGSKSDPDPTLDPSNMFGSVFVRLKDDVRDRTTATFGDSMSGPRVAVPLTEAGRDRLVGSIADPADDVRASLVRAAVSPEFAEDAASLAASTWFRRLPDDLREIIAKRIRYRERVVSFGPDDRNFIEAQIHGGVSLSDVAEIVIPDEQGRLGESAIEMLKMALDAGVTVRTTAGRVPVETDYGWQFIVPGSDESVDQKSLPPIIEVKAIRKRSYLIIEPYDPDAKDGDGDGIVQEWTVWERPAGTRILDSDGREIPSGEKIESTALTARPAGLRIVDADNNPVDYTPSYMPRPEEGTIGADVGRLTPEAAAPQSPPPAPTTGARGTPLGDIGTQSLREQGMPTIRDAARPATPPVQQPAVTPPPQAAVTRSDPPVEERKSIWRRYFPGVWRRSLDEDYNDLRNEKLQSFEQELKDFIGSALRKLISLGGASDELSFLLGDETGINVWVEFIIKELGPFIRDEQAFREMIRRQLLVLNSDLPENLPEELTTSLLRASKKFQEDVEDLVTEELMSQLQPDMLDAIIEALASSNLSQGDGPIGVRINEGPLEQVLTSGRMKSQFETGTSEGAYVPNARRRLEGRFMGVPEDIPNILRPIYGYIVRKKTKLKHTEDGELVEVPLDPSTWMDAKDKYVEGYGTYEIRVKPEVRERVTYTVGDSLGVEMTPIPFSEDSLREIARNLGMPPDDLDAVRRQLAITAASWIEPDTFHWALAGLLQRLPTDRREALVKLLAKHNQFKTRDMHFADYVEAQIHGGLDIEDIDRIMVPYESLDEVPEAIKRLAEIHGITLELKEPSEEKPIADAVEAPKTWTTTTPMF